MSAEAGPSAEAREPQAEGRFHFATAWRLAAAAYLGCAVLQFLLYLRPSPYGGPFLLQWKAFIIRPLVYELLATTLIALPFLLFWLLRYRKSAGPRGRFLHFALAGLMALNLLITQLDHELYRFLGLRLGPSYLVAYGQPGTMMDSLFLDILRADRGGPFVALLLTLGAPSLYSWWAARLIGRRARRPVRTPGFVAAAAMLGLPLATGVIGYWLANAEFRLSRLEPAIFAIARDFRTGFEDSVPPEDYAASVHDWQSGWLAASSDRNWRFPYPDYPYYRVPIDPRVPTPGDRWNIVILQLETLRGVDIGFLRPDRSGSATPYLDSLAAAPNAAVYSRALSLGPPSINGIFATQCSIIPPSRRFVTTLTSTDFHCLPEALRGLGYRAEFFSASDTDMENSTRWITRWYDSLWRYPELGQRDREVFRRVAPRLRELGRRGPFLATILSASNHFPFRSPEPRFETPGTEAPAERILETTRYTDDVVRELIESLRSEPWFARTLFVILGDHGYNMGEHGGAFGAYSLYRESVWIPLLIVGPHPRLPAGRHDRLVTMLDIAPTIADLIGLRAANSWQGHSLLARRDDAAIFFGFRNSLLAQTGSWTALRDPNDGGTRLFARDDWLQRRDLGARSPALAAALLARADRARRFNDYLLRHGRIVPPGD